jgi:hypothetical protein
MCVKKVRKYLAPQGTMCVHFLVASKRGINPTKYKNDKHTPTTQRAAIARIDLFGFFCGVPQDGAAIPRMYHN